LPDDGVEPWLAVDATSACDRGMRGVSGAVELCTQLFDSPDGVLAAPRDLGLAAFGWSSAVRSPEETASSYAVFPPACPGSLSPWERLANLIAAIAAIAPALKAWVSHLWITRYRWLLGSREGVLTAPRDHGVNCFGAFTCCARIQAKLVSL
jgi:hypothetical protein